MNSKLLGIFVVTALILSSFAGLTLAEEKPIPVIIGFKEGHSDDAQALVRAHGGMVQNVWSIIPAMSVTISPKAIEALQNNPNVIYVEEDAMVYALGRPSSPPGKDKSGREQPPQEVPWGITQIGADSAWATSTGTNVKVAVLDTGIDPTHPDLIDNVKGGVSVVGRFESSLERNWTDRNGHGTHCAGIIAASNNEIGVVGVAPDAHLYAVKVLNNAGMGSYSDIIDGIQWAVNNNMQVISMSFGAGVDSIAMRDACNAAYVAGLILVAAAGNEGDGDPATTETLYPAAYECVIAVGATNRDNIAPYFSNSGPHLELVAPGVGIKSTFTNGSYKIYSGTSMSCPHVSGTVALILALNPIDARAILQATAYDLGDIEKDNLYGYGLVDALESVKAAP